MKTKILILVALILGTTSFTPDDKSKNQTEYQVVRDESGIRISTRWIPVTDTRSARQIKCEFTVDGPVRNVIAVLNNDNSIVNWMKGTKEYYRVKTIDAGQWYSYVQFRLPWPLNNQDCIIRYNLSKDASGKTVVVRMTGEPDYLKHFDGVTRIPHMEGSWVFTEIGNGRVHIEYVMFSNQVSKFPRWITDPIIQNNMVEMMSAFRSKVHEEVTKKLADNEIH